MQYQSDSDTLEVKRRPGGALIAVGVPLDGGLFIQEYWARGVPFYAVANASAEAATVAVVEWNREPGRRLLGPWTLPPGSVRHYDAQSIVTGYKGSLVAVSLNETVVYGLLKSPLPPAGPPGWDEAEGVLTTYGLNGVGDRHADLQCLQSELSFASEQVVTLTMRIRWGGGAVTFKNADAPAGLPTAVVVGAASQTLPVVNEADSYVVGKSRTPEPGDHEVTLDVRLPRCESETMAALWGHCANPAGGGFSFGRGLVVRGGR